MYEVRPSEAHDDDPPGPYVPGDPCSVPHCPACWAPMSAEDAAAVAAAPGLAVAWLRGAAVARAEASAQAEWEASAPGAHGVVVCHTPLSGPLGLRQCRVKVRTSSVTHPFVTHTDGAASIQSRPRSLGAAPPSCTAPRGWGARYMLD